MCDIIALLEISIANTFIFVLGAISAIWFSYSFIKARRAKSLGSDQCLYIMGLIYYSIIIMAFIIYTIKSIMYCIQKSTAIDISSITLYVLQYIFLILLLFYRLYFIFKGTAYALAFRTKICFYVTYALLIIMLLISIWTSIISLEDRNIALWYSINTLTVILALALIAALVVLYIHKLVNVFKRAAIDETSNDQKMVAVAVKAFILTLTSLISLIITTISGSLDPLLGSGSHRHFFHSVFIAFDLYTNFVSIVFGFRQFKDYYMKVCGCCDAKCMSCWTKMMSSNAQSELAHNVKADDVEINSDKTETV